MARMLSTSRSCAYFDASLMDSREVTSSGYTPQLPRSTQSGVMSDMFATYQVQHDFAKKHVLERAECTRVVLCAQVLERLVEVGVCGRVVLVLRV